MITGEVEIKATITIQELQSLVVARGQLNRSPITDSKGVTYDSMALKFVGYAGKSMGDGTVDGTYFFNLSQPGDADRDLFEFGSYPGISFDEEAPSFDDPEVIEEGEPETVTTPDDEAESEVEDDGV